MPSKVTEKVYLPGVEAEFKKLFGRKIIVGPAAAEGSELAKYIAANEFGAVITPKSGRFLAVPLTKEAKERSPREFSDLFPVFPKTGTPYLAVNRGGKIVPMYLLKQKVVIPERAAIRTTMDKRDTVDKAMNIAEQGLRRLLAGTGTAQNVLDGIGLSIVASLKANIASNLGPPNSPLTLSLKRNKTTLIDEGQYLKSIQHEVI